MSTPTIYAWAGGTEALSRWLDTRYNLVEADERLAPAFDADPRSSGGREQEATDAGDRPAGRVAGSGELRGAARRAGPP